MKRKKFLSHVLSLIMILSTVFWIAPTASADYDGVDYSRFNYKSDGRVYPASLYIGDIKFSGTLRCTNNFDLGDINDAIAEFFEATGFSERDILSAQKKIKDAEKDRQFTYEDGVRIASNLLSILGGDTAQEVATFLVEDLCKVLLSEDKGQTLADMAIDAVIKELDVIDGNLQEAAIDEAFWKVFNTSFDSFADEFSVEWDKLGKINPMSMLVETLKISYQEYKLDVERWNRRVEAVEARDFLNDFYDAVNLILSQREGSSGTWQLKIISTRDRYFSFYGSENNLQRWNVVVNMYGESNKTASPQGLFEGTVALYASHNMRPFDSHLWYSQFGRFKEGWLNDVISTGFYKVYMSGGTHITRSIVTNNASFRITGMDIARTFSSRAKGLPIEIKFDSASFEIDDIYVSSTRSITVETSVGFQDASENLTGYVVVDMALHAEGIEGGGDGIRIVRDKAHGDVGILFFGKTKVDEPPGEEAVIWDSNIWRPLEGGVTLRIGG